MKINKSRFISSVVLISLFISFIGWEWFRGRYDLIPSSITHTGRLLPLVMVIATVFLNNALFFRSRRADFIRWYNLWVVSILIILFVRVFVFPGSERMFVFVLQIIQAILFGYIGYGLIRDTRETLWLLKKVAWAGAIIGFLDAVGFVGGIRDTSLIFPGHPMRLFVLFGYCWYLSVWLKSSKGFITNIGLLGCVAGVWVTFHKPIVFAAGLSTLALFWVYLLFERKKRISLLRISAFIAIASVSLIIVNSIYSGQIVNYATEHYYSAFIRAEPGTSITDLDDEGMLAASGGRLDMWSVAIEIIKQNFFLGTGERTMFGSMNNLHIHNWFLDVLVWGGVLGALPFFVGLYWWFKFATRTKALRQAGDVLTPSLSFTIGITAYNLGGTMFAFPTIFSFIMLTISMAARYTHNLTGQSKHA